MTSRRLSGAITGIAILASTTAGCGGHSHAAGPPARVPLELAPTALGSGKYSVKEDDRSRKTFISAGPKALISDGRLWAIRVASSNKLIGALQISTMKPDIDFARAKARQNLENILFTGTTENIGVGDVDVIVSRTEDRAVYLWFGRDLFEVLQLKRSQKDPIDEEAMLQELFGFQTSGPQWKGLPGAGGGNQSGVG